MNIIKKKWNELSLLAKVMVTLRLILSFGVVIVSFLGLSGLLEVAVTNTIAIPSLGVIMLLSVIDEMKRYKLLAGIYFAAAIFILSTSFFILMGRLLG